MTTAEATKTYLVADLFCGAGGSSTGAQKAVRGLGAEMVLTCVNHWPVAIATHKANHPEARHYVQDIAAADPRELVPEGRLDLLMASPECTWHSRARGGKPVNDQQRMPPFSVLNWLSQLDVRCVLIEAWSPWQAEQRFLAAFRETLAAVKVREGAPS